MILQDIRNYFIAKQQAMEGVDHFVFGVDEKSLRDMVSTYSGIYMFVDYGQMDSSSDNYNRISDRLECAVTIARPIGANNFSSDEVNAVAFACFDLIVSLRKMMYREQVETPWLKHLSPSHAILPFVAPDIARSIGSTLTFRVEGYDLIGIKAR